MRLPDDSIGVFFRLIDNLPPNVTANSSTFLPRVLVSEQNHRPRALEIMWVKFAFFEQIYSYLDVKHFHPSGRNQLKAQESVLDYRHFCVCDINFSSAGALAAGPIIAIEFQILPVSWNVIDDFAVVLRAISNVQDPSGLLPFPSLKNFYYIVIWKCWI